MQHFLKTWPQYFSEIAQGRKTFEIRSCKDRVFQAGDSLLLQEFDPVKNQYGSNPPIEVDVVAVYYDLPGLQPGHVGMSIRDRIPESEEARHER